jgi:hypothetical protein
MQCTNHMKQIGLAVHNFESATGKLPPMDIHFGHATTLLLLWPYMEQQALYDVIDNWRGGNDPSSGFGQDLCRSPSEPGDTFWRNTEYMTDALRRQLSSVTYVKCPSRRAGVAGAPLTDVELSTGTTISGCQSIVSYGPFADYGIVIYTTYQQPDCTNLQWVGSGDNGGAYAMNPGNKSPFRRAIVSTPGDERSWAPHDPMSYWVDGTSNQFIFGEKHMPIGILGTETVAFRHDQNYLAATNGNGRDWACGRAVCEQYPLATPRDTNAPQRYFGSWHAGVCNFLLGDGAVRSVSVTAPGKTLGHFAHVSDGGTASL